MKKFIKELVVDAIADERTQAAVLALLKKMLADPGTREFVEDLLGTLITERILPLLPVAVGAAVKAAVDQIVAKVPTLDGVVDLAKATDGARNELNDLIPDIDFGIPALDNLLDWWRPKGR